MSGYKNILYIYAVMLVKIIWFTKANFTLKINYSNYCFNFKLLISELTYIYNKIKMYVLKSIFRNNLHLNLV